MFYNISFDVQFMDNWTSTSNKQTLHKNAISQFIIRQRPG